MNIFKRKGKEKIPEEKDFAMQATSNESNFKNTMKIDNYEEKIKFLRIKEDLVQGKIEEKDLSKEELDEVAKLLEEEIAQYDVKIKNLRAQVEKYKRSAI